LSERDRDAGKRRIAPAIGIAVDRLGALEGAIGHYRVERVQLRVERGDPGQRLAADLGG
jgi:hypothetical protein